MFHVEFDPSKSLLSIGFSQHVGEDEAKLCLERIRLLLDGRHAPFRLLTDLSGLESMDLACRPYIDSTMDLCANHDVQTVVRVIPDPHKDIGFSIMSLFHYGRQVRILTCDTLNEAMRVLAE